MHPPTRTCIIRSLSIIAYGRPDVSRRFRLGPWCLSNEGADWLSTYDMRRETLNQSTYLSTGSWRQIMIWQLLS